MKICINCKSNLFKVIARVKNRDIIVCGNCKLITVNPLPTERQLSKIINGLDNEFVSEYKKEIKSYKKYFTKKTTHLNNIYPKRGALLDIGCSSGIFLNIAKESGWDAFGIDASAEAVKECRKNKLKVKKSTFENVRLQDKSFDVVTAYQVIEHFRNPLLFLGKVRKILKENGRLILTTPDQKGFSASFLGKYWFEYYNLEHLYFFTQDSLSDLVKKAGFSIEHYELEMSRDLEFNYIWERLLNYYYTKKTLLHAVIKLFSFLPKVAKNFKINEPKANIYLIARKK